MDVLGEEVAVTKSGPRRTVIRIQRRHLLVVVDGSWIVTLGCAELGQLTQIVESHELVWILALGSVSLPDNSCGGLTTLKLRLVRPRLPSLNVL